MADLNITPALVIPSGFGDLKRAPSGVAISAGDVIYLDKEDGKKAKLADANDGLAKADVAGIAVTTSGVGQPVLYLAEDTDFDLGVTVGSGQTVILSGTPGGICPDADGVSGFNKVILGVGKGGTKINLKILRGGLIP